MAFVRRESLWALQEGRAAFVKVFPDPLYENDVEVRLPWLDDEIGNGARLTDYEPVPGIVRAYRQGALAPGFPPAAGHGPLPTLEEGDGADGGG